MLPSALNKNRPENEHLQRLKFRLNSIFSETPFEDGIYSPAEEVLEKALQSDGKTPVLEWLAGLCVNTEDPSLSASVLRCLSRQLPGTPLWRANVIRAALKTDSLYIRDAAGQAAESWGDPEIRNVLQNHKEPIDWLRQYMEGIASDLRG